MAKGKYRRKFHARKSTALVVSLLLMLALSIGGILAFLTDTSTSVENIFTPSEVTTEVIEKLDGNVKKNVQIKNTGDTTAWIRAAVIVTWQDKDGNVYGKAPVFGTDYTMSSLGSGWTQGDDKFYYYTSPVKSDNEDANNCFTGVLFEEIKPIRTCEDANYFLNVEIIGSGIQYKPAHVFNDNWGASSGLTANDDCTALS